MSVAESEVNNKEIELHRELSKVFKYRYRERFSELYLEYWNETMRKYLPEETSLWVLECGCGTGHFTEYLSNRYKGVVGIDISIDMLSSFDKNRNNKMINASIQNLPFVDKSFDVVVVRETLHHLQNQIIALKEISRVLKPEGVFVLSEASNDALWLRIPRRIFYRFSRKFNKQHKALNSSDLSRDIALTGLRVLDKRYFGYIGPPLCIIPDFLPLMRYAPFKEKITYLLIKLDEMCSHIPGLKKQAWSIMMRAEFQ